MDRSSRTRQAPRAQAAFPVQVNGFAVGWFHQFKENVLISLSPTFLGAQQNDNNICYGVIYKVTASDLAATDSRELGYERTPVKSNAIKLLTGDGVQLDSSDSFWIYVSTTNFTGTPDENFPLVQSYVDLCINGTIEAEQSYPVGAKHFTQNWIFSIDWQSVQAETVVYWVNDRMYPYRASFTVPNASLIDAALAGNQKTTYLWSRARKQFFLPAKL
jgi:hypothetical protein